MDLNEVDPVLLDQLDLAQAFVVQLPWQLHHDRKIRLARHFQNRDRNPNDRRPVPRRPIER